MAYTQNVIDGGGAPGDPEIYLTVSQTADTSVQLSVFDGGTVPEKYRVIFQRQKRVAISERDSYYENVGSQIIVDIIPLTGVKTFSGLMAGGVYNITFQKVNGSSVQSISIQYYFIMSTVSADGSYIAKPTDPTQVSSNKSYFELSSASSKINKFVVATRQFDSTHSPFGFFAGESYPGGTHTTSSNKYYIFGTALFMEPVNEAPHQSSGIGFFLNAAAKSGYYLKVESTGSAATGDRNTINIYFADGTKLNKIADSQMDPVTRLDKVLGGKFYCIDIKVKVDYANYKVFIDAYINGFKVSATHTISSATAWKNLVSNHTGIFSEQGKTFFDYVYAKSITEKQYNEIKSNVNYYAGQFSNDLLEINFGETFYNFNSDDDDYAKSEDSVEEFGKVVREIAYVKTKFSARPSFPIRWSVGSNRFAKIIASKTSNFSAEAYVLNTASTSIPLQSSKGDSFYLFGSKLSSSGQVEYSTDDTDLYTTTEPLVFTSRWIQNKADAKNIAEWIKSKFINRGQIISMSVFGNPILSIGDIVTIKYPYEGLDGTAAKKFIITNITQSFDQGLETTILCRSL